MTRTLRVPVTIAAKIVGLAVIVFAVLALSTAALGIRDALESDTTAILGSSPGSPADGGTSDRPLASAESAGPTEQIGLALLVLGVCLMQSAALALFIVLSRWSGWRLASSVFVIGFAILAVLPQIEALVFLTQMSRVLIGRIVLSSAVTWAVFSPLAVWLLGRGREGHHEASGAPMVSRSIATWTGVLAVLGSLHVVLYLVFGYYVAWRVPEVAHFYGGEDPGGLLSQMQSVADSAPWFYLLQFARGLLWGVVAALVALAITGSRLVAALAAAGIFGILAPSLLLLPNPVLPDTVRWVHFWETLLSRSTFGLAAVWLVRTVLVVDRGPADVGRGDRDRPSG